MGKLTTQQYIDGAATICRFLQKVRFHWIDEWTDEIAAVLQIRWDKITVEELKVLTHETGHHNLESVMNRLIEIRNANLHGIPDPRRSRLIDKLRTLVPPDHRDYGQTLSVEHCPAYGKWADEILRVLDDQREDG